MKLFEIGTVTTEEGKTLTAIAGNKVTLNIVFGAMAIGSAAFLGHMAGRGAQKVQALMIEKMKKDNATEEATEEKSEENNQ